MTLLAQQHLGHLTQPTSMHVPAYVYLTLADQYPTPALVLTLLNIIRDPTRSQHSLRALCLATSPSCHHACLPHTTTPSIYPSISLPTPQRPPLPPSSRTSVGRIPTPLRGPTLPPEKGNGQDTLLSPGEDTDTGRRRDSLLDRTPGGAAAGLLNRGRLGCCCCCCCWWWWYQHYHHRRWWYQHYHQPRRYW